MAANKSKLGSWVAFWGPGRAVKKRLESKWYKLYRMAYAWTHDPHLSADLVQDTLTKALRHWRQLQDAQAIDSWLYSILANCWRDYGRKKRDTVDIEDIELVDDSDPEHESYRIELVKKVRMAVAELTPEQRQIVTLIDLEGCSYSEVAEILNIPVGTVMSRLCRARRRLQDLLQQPEPSEVNVHGNVLRLK